MRNRAANRWAGWRAKKAGDSFENRLAGLHSIYALHRVATIFKLPVPSRNLSRAEESKYHLPPGRFCHRLARQLYDFTGYAGSEVHKAGWPNVMPGTTIAMEAKSTRPGVTSLAISASGSKGIQLHQLDAVVAALESRCIGTILWERGGELYFLPPGRVVEAKRTFERGGRRSIPFSAFVHVPLQPSPAVGMAVLADWLGALLTWSGD